MAQGHSGRGGSWRGTLSLRTETKLLLWSSSAGGKERPMFIIGSKVVEDHGAVCARGERANGLHVIRGGLGEMDICHRRQAWSKRREGTEREMAGESTAEEKVW